MPGSVGLKLKSRLCRCGRTITPSEASEKEAAEEERAGPLHGTLQAFPYYCKSPCKDSGFLPGKVLGPHHGVTVMTMVTGPL